MARICLLRGGRTKLLHRRIDRAHLDFGCSRRTAVCGHGASSYPYVVRMYLGEGVQADTCVARVARGVVSWCGVWKVEGVSPYVGVGIGGIGWNYGGPLIG